MTGKEYRTITDVKGPLVFLNKTEPVAFGEIVSLRLSNGTIKNGQVLDTSNDLVIVQVFEGTAKIDRESGVTFMGDVFKLPVSTDLVGRRCFQTPSFNRFSRSYSRWCRTPS